MLLMSNKQKAIFAWLFFGLIVIGGLANVYAGLRKPPPGTSVYQLADGVIWSLAPMVFALVGALIVSHQPRNAIGWVLMIPALLSAIPADSYLAQFVAAPASPTPLLFLALWFSNWNWLLLIFPILLIMLLFPTGQPPPGRWGWLLYFGGGMGLFLILLGTFGAELGPIDGNWTVRNPIGFITQDWVDRYFLIPWVGSLAVLTALCVASLFVRFSRARAVEREQIKWLFYACSLFVVIYIPSLIWSDFTAEFTIWSIVFVLGIQAIPVSIAIAILRYHLYDIDIIIRRTLQYALLTGLLALVYLGSVVLLQNLVDRLIGEQNQLVIVISTLGIAALFSPLRLRVQRFVDRRFFRQKYDAERALAQFSVTARDEVDIERLVDALLSVVRETLQPAGVSLMLAKTTNDGFPPSSAAGASRGGAGPAG